MLLYPLAGAALGFLTALILVTVMVGGASPGETAAITLFVGAFLAGCGAIAGAILGGLASLKRRQEARVAHGPISQT
jgi:hypothetical protein